MLCTCSEALGHINNLLLQSFTNGDPLPVVGIVGLSMGGQDESERIAIMPSFCERIPKLLIEASATSAKNDQDPSKGNCLKHQILNNPFTIVVDPAFSKEEEDNRDEEALFDLNLWTARLVAKYTETLSAICWPSLVQSKI